MTLRIVADANMPQVEAIFAPIADVRLKEGRSLSRADLTQTDVLLVRSITAVNERLLRDTPVKFVGTATAGLDHIDQAWLSAQGIGFSSAAGANARSVVEYDLACFAWLYQTLGWNVFKAKNVGVVAYGNVGRRLVRQLQALGIDVLVYDPMAAVPEGVAVEGLMALSDCDCICVHAPFSRTGDYPSENMLSAPFLSVLKPGCVVISAGRGGVIDEAALKPLLQQQRIVYCCDVWQGEPRVNPTIVDLASLATPHIAGYSVDSKIAATRMLFDAVSDFFGLASATSSPTLTTATNPLFLDEQASDMAAFFSAIAEAFPIQRDDQRFRQNVDQFDRLRATYWQRQEFANFEVVGGSASARQRLVSAGFNLGA